jgi:hypothetical protein
MSKILPALLIALLAACGGGDEPEVRACPEAFDGNFSAHCAVTIDPSRGATIDVSVELELTLRNPTAGVAPYSHQVFISFDGDMYAPAAFTGALPAGQTVTVPVRLSHRFRGTATNNRPIDIGVSSFGSVGAVTSSARDVRIRVDVH